MLNILKKLIKTLLPLRGGLGWGLLLLTSCTSDEITPAHQMRFMPIHPSAASRVTDTAFDVGDKIGLYVTADTALLQIAGNTVNNEPLTYDGTQWNARRQLYWDDGMFRVCAYYPHQQTIGSISDCPVAVATDQSLGRGEYTATLSAYEASDILFAQADSVTASDSAVPLRFVHTMSRLVIRLIKGEDYEGDLPRSVDVFVHNTVPEATLNLNNGIVTKNIRASRKTIKARQESDYTYAAIIVPQRLPTHVPLVEVDINGMSYLCEASFTFKPGTQHVINFILDRNPDQSLITIDGELQNW